MPALYIQVSINYKYKLMEDMFLILEKNRMTRFYLLKCAKEQETTELGSVNVIKKILRKR